MSRTPDPLVRAVEATLFAAEEPMTAEAISTHLGGAEVREALAELAAHYRGRGIEMVERGKRWHFQTAGDLAHFGLQSRKDLPGIDELRAAGLLDPVEVALEAAMAGRPEETDTDSAAGLASEEESA